MFGFIAVLPGAFSAYRYSALLNSSDGTGPLQKYFIGEQLHAETGKPSVRKANMYLAEDRILCFELVTKKKCAYRLKYVKGAAAETVCYNSVNVLRMFPIESLNLSLNEDVG